jgi:mannobiose 2-epimerase
MIATFDSCLKKGILEVWYPRVIDTADGGYLTNFTFNWTADSLQPKMLVSQSRLMWTSSQAAMFYNDTNYIGYARHGFRFVKKYMWDSVYGGFFNLRSQRGGYLDQMYRNQKMTYGNVFAIYGLVSYYNISKDTAALNLAKKTFLWLDNNSYDKVNGGYVDAMNQDGTWLAGKEKNGAKAVKDFNSTIHILEAFTELYKVWPDTLVKNRLEHLLTLVRDTFVDPKGYLRLYFTEDWKHITNRDSGMEVIHKRKAMDHISFGHDIETAFLLLEASHGLGIGHDTTTLLIARKLVDHSLSNGFDHNAGCFYGEGYYIPGRDSVTILEKKAQWWVQAEGLNALLLMSEIYPDDKKYRIAFQKIWKFIKTNLMDKEYGEWYIEGLNFSPQSKTAPKASIWKVNYHNSRALMNGISLLKNENEVALQFRKIAL